MNRTFSIETVDSGSIPNRVKSKIIKTTIYTCLLSAEIKRDSVKPPPCVLDRWQFDSIERLCYLVDKVIRKQKMSFR